MVLWSPRLQESADFVTTFGAVARRYAGRFQLVTVDVDANPTILQAFQVQAVPVSFAFVQSQPVPLFEGAQPEAQITAVIDQVLQLAAQHGVTGTVTVGDDAAAPEESEQEQPLPPLHQKAFDAIESGDLDVAAAAYREALAQSPADSDAKLGWPRSDSSSARREPTCRQPAPPRLPRRPTSTPRSSSRISTCSAVTSRTRSCASSTPSGSPLTPTATRRASTSSSSSRSSGSPTSGSSGPASP